MQKIKVSNHAPQCNCIQCNPNIISKPAITFEGTNVYTVNGEVITIPSEINEIMANVSIVLENDTFKHLSENATNLNIANLDISVLTAIVAYTTSSVIGNFTTTLQNIYDVFINRLILALNKVEYDAPFNFGEVLSSNIKNLEVEFSSNDSLFRFVVNYIELSPDERIKSEGAVINFATSFVNEYGIYIYQNTKKCINKVISDYVGDNSEQAIRDVYDIFTSLFKSMMGDMTFEISLFVNNLIATGGILISANDVKNMVNQIESRRTITQYK